MSDNKKLSIKFADNVIKNDFVEYTILCKDSNNDTWTIVARYSQLRQLHRRLKEVAPLVTLPEFPPKKWLGNMETSFISQRQKALENYFNNLLANEQIRDLEPINTFIYKSPRPASKTSGSVVKADGSSKPKTDKSSQIENIAGNGKGDTKMNAQISNTIELNKVIDNINKRFFDLSYTLSPPEEEELRKKKLQYEKIKVEVVGANTGTNLPVGKEENLITVKDETVVMQNPELIKMLQECAASICDEMTAITLQFASNKVVHFLSTA